jgi:hypothetical protein
MSRRLVRSSRVAALSGFGLSLLAVLAGCIPPSPPQAALKGRWVFLASAANTEISQFTVSFNAAGDVSSVMYQIGERSVRGDAGPTGFTTVTGGLVNLSTTFAGGTFSFNGTLSSDQLAISGFATLRLTETDVEVAVLGRPATLARDAVPEAGEATLTGTWRLSTESTLMRDVYVEFDNSGTPTSFSRQIGQADRRTDTTVTGSSTVSDEDVSFDVSGVGLDTLVFAGAFDTSDQRLLRGTITARASTAGVAGSTQISVQLQVTSGLLAKLADLAPGTVSLEGQWNYVDPVEDPDPAIEQLQLIFGADNRLASIGVQLAGEEFQTFTNLATQTIINGSLVSISAEFSGGQFLFFTGPLSGDQALMVGGLSFKFLEATLSDEPAILVKPAS